MASKKYPEAEFMIPSDQLVAHAIVGTAKNAAVNPDLARWAPGTVNRTPQVIYDINGQPLFYDFLADDERKRRLARFKKADGELAGLTAKMRREVLAARTVARAVDVLKLVYTRTATKLLQYCTHYGHTHARSHHCFSLKGQQVNDYCAVATCQMILCYYRYYYSQNDIAPALGYNAGGGCPPDQSPGYESLTCNHLDSSFDASATWEKARDQINLLRPMKSGIPGHARAVAGYSYTWWKLSGIQDKKLYIYDPWPWNADYALGGAVVWEDWDAITHTNYVYANVDCP